jgi:hypothetical protein
MTVGTATERQLTLVAADRRYDLVVPLGARVIDMLSILGIASSASPHAVATPTGLILGPHDVVDESIESGAVLSVVRMTTHALHRDILNLDRSGLASGSREAPEASGARISAAERAAAAQTVDTDDATRRRGELVPARPQPAPETTASRRGHLAVRSVITVDTAAKAPAIGHQLAGLAAALGLLVCVLAALGLRSGHDLSAPTGLVDGGFLAQWATTLLLLGCAAGLAVLSTHAGFRFVATVAAPALGLAAGLSLPLADSPGRPAVALVAGCGIAVLLLATTRARAQADIPGSRTVLGAFGGVAVLVAAGTMVGAPGWAIAAVLTGLAPLVVRMLPSASLSVDPNQLVDTDRLSTTVWSVRERSQGRRRRIDNLDLADRFRTAREVVAIGTAYLSLGAAVAGWLTVVAAGRDGLSRWTSTALVACVALALGYQSRSVRDGLPRSAMLLAAAALAGATAYSLVETTGWRGAPATLFIVGMIVAAVTVLGATAVARGYRSTRLSRFADALESLAVTLALPLALVAAGGIEALRRLTSG